ncbi:MAG: hypothetical protein WB443_10540 [Nitrososphaeraceae archaeon]
MDKKYIYYLVITVIGVFFVLYFYNTQINKPKFGLEVDPTKDTTDISGIQYRIRVTNVGMKQLTGIVVDLGKNDVQHLSLLDPGQSYYFYPKTDTLVSNVKVMTNDGIHAQAGYRSPTKVLGLPGTGR